MRFATIEDVRASLPVAVSTIQGPYLETLLEAASDAIESACRRKFIRQVYTEYFDGGDGERTAIRLTALPVDTGQAFQLWDDPGRVFGPESLLPADTYVLNAESGYLERVGSLSVFPRTRQVATFLPGLRSIKATYTGGYATASKNNQTVVQVPSRVRLATLALVRAWLLNQDAVGRGGTPPRQGTTVDQTAVMPTQVLTMLGPERRMLF